MTRTVGLLCGLLALLWRADAVSATEGVEKQVLIWGGSREAAEASALQAALTGGKEPRLSQWKLAPGFPSLIESHTLPGLHPGFHIVILGFCSRQEAPAILAELKAVHPGAYARTVTVPEGTQGASCPQPKGPATWAPELEPARKALQAAEAAEKSLRKVERIELSEGDPRTGRFAALVHLRTAEGDLKVELVGLRRRGKALTVLGRTGVEPTARLRAGLIRISPQEVAVGLSTPFGDPPEEEGEEPGSRAEGSRLGLYHLTEEGPGEVLEFLDEETRSDPECTTRTRATYVVAERKDASGFYPLDVTTTKDDVACREAYRRPDEQGEALEPTRQTRRYSWQQGRYQP